MGWLAVCLAEVGLFRLSILAFSWGVGVVGLIGLTVRRGGWAALGSLPRWSGNWWQGRNQVRDEGRSGEAEVRRRVGSETAKVRVAATAPVGSAWSVGKSRSRSRSS